ncbi:long-chain fatty acid--CoA ligase [Streptomyces luomodiensis]|uniref:Long-chain fatty acid--CoA ligase n=1 Tax=Streptomyces luomodiensis TaxID=3026192 RepID=A0ABY9VDZ5_9ACTN|nr:long-chain fatty acid--CoA ligase [Streptomyces sp. SCA4-21]WNF00916.1 long-chain fatty acid--CoA ligase [Streptomyces sp. SCA4-21]
MRNHGVGSWTARRARKTPHRAAVVHGGVQITYAQLHDRSTRLAHHLRHLGVRPGDRVAFLGPNHPSFLETFFAAGQLGAIFVPLNTRLAEPELRHCLTDSGASVLVHTPAFAPFALSCGTPRLVPVGDTLDEDLAAGTPAPLDVPVTHADTAVIMYTSGTTGRAKGAVLTHGNLIWNSLNTLVDGEFAAGDVTLLSAPLFHTAALNMTCLPTVLKGGTLVLEESFSPARTLDLVERLRVTVMFGVPAMFQQIAAEPRFAEADLSSLRMLLCGGAPVPEALIRTYQRRGLGFLQGYGMTEASPGVCLLDAEHALAKPGSAGLPHFFSDIRLVDPAGDDAPHGELLVEGPNVMSGYWNLPEETAAAFQDGWFRSGDIARTDEDGYVTLVDRAKDMIISGGENIYPAEIENLLYEHPAVGDCAVIGVRDDTWGEVPRAVVVLAPGVRASAEDILASLEGRLARYKIPKSLVFTDALPRSGAGKLLKPRIRDHFGTTS